MLHVWGQLDIHGAWYLDGHDRKHVDEIRQQIKAQDLRLV